MRVAAVVLAVSLLIAVLWLAGEKHRENCIREQRSGCSVLLWENGHKPSGGYNFGP